MDGEIQAAADIATGAVLAKAIEPDTGGAVASSDDNVCLNCGAIVTGSFCSACGQKRKVHRTLSAFGHDILHSVLHFDGKIWRTLPLVVWRPGDLTRRYIHGERAKFVSPLALFLFTVFLTFALFNSIVPQNVAPPSINTDKSKQEFESNRSTLGAKIKEQEKLLADAKAKGTPTTEFESELKDLRIAHALMGTAEAAVTGKPAPKDNWSFVAEDFPGAERLNETVKKAGSNPQLLLYKIQSNAYKFSWALIPISVPFVWLLFMWRRQFKMFDHAVFVTYSLCFMMVALSVAAILINRGTFEVVGGFILALAPPIHMYRQLKQAYGLRRRSAFWRMLILLSFAGFALTLFGILIVALGVSG
jgi:hypothetical protein